MKQTARNERTRLARAPRRWGNCMKKNTLGHSATWFNVFLFEWFN